MKPTVKDLPYPNMPTTLQGQINKLADITGIRRNLLTGAGETELQAMCYVILYRHLSQQQRHKAMKTIRSVKKRALMGVLIDKALTTTFVNPNGVSGRSLMMNYIVISRHMNKYNTLLDLWELVQAV